MASSGIPICFSSHSLFLPFFLFLFINLDIPLFGSLSLHPISWFSLHVSLSFALIKTLAMFSHSLTASFPPFFHFLSSTESFYTHEAALLSARPWLSNTSYWRHMLNAGVRRCEETKKEKSQMTSQFFLIESSEIAWRSNGDFCLETSENQKIPLSSHTCPLVKRSWKYIKLFSKVQSKGISVDLSSKSSIYTTTLPLCCQHLSHLCIF